MTRLENWDQGFPKIRWTSDFCPNVSIVPNYAAVSDPSNPFPTFRKDSISGGGHGLFRQWGKHAFRFGGQVHRVQVNGVQNSFGRGSVRI